MTSAPSSSTAWSWALPRVMPGLVLLVAVGVGAACTPSFTPAPGARISCTDASGCPEGWTCNLNLGGRCVNGADTTDPSIVGEVRVEPPVLKEGAVATITFEVSEELAGSPEVTVKLAQTTELIQDEARSHDRTYVFTHTATRDSPQGVDCPISIVLTDLNGNRSGNVAAKSLRFDFVKPEIDEHSLTGSPATSDGLVTLNLRVSEALATSPAPVVSLPNGRLFERDTTATGSLEYKFTYRPRKGVDPEGVEPIRVEMEDQAHNPQVVESVDSVRFDFSAPQVLSLTPPADAAPFIRNGGLVTLVVEVDEPLGPSSVRLGQTPLSPQGSSGQPAPDGGTTYLYAFSHLVQGERGSPDAGAGGDEPGPRAVELVLVDVAGNKTATIAGPTVTYDFEAPRLGKVEVSPKRVHAGSPFQVSFTVDEPLPSTPVVVVDNHANPPVALKPTTPVAGFDYSFAGSAPSESGDSPYYTVVVTMVDRAGNQGTSSPATVEIDNVRPTLAGLEVGPAQARLNDTIRVVLSADETLAGPPVLVARLTEPPGAATITLEPVDVAPGKVSYGYRHTVSAATVQGKYALTPFDLVDQATNTTPVTPTATFTVDYSSPQVSTPIASRGKYGTVAPFDRVAVTFTVSEDVGAGLVATVGGTPLGCGPPATTASGLQYTCTHDIQSPPDTEGMKQVNVQATDSAGNAGIASARVEYDFSAPTLSSGAPSQPAFKLGDPLLYMVTASEPLSGPPSLHVLLDGVEQAGFFGSPVAQTGMTFSYKRSAVAPDGHYTVKVDLTDPAGNAATGLPGAPFDVDRAAPAVTPGTVYSSNQNPTLVARGDTVTAVFTVNEALAVDPAVLLASAEMRFISRSGSGPITYTYAQSNILAGAEGFKSVTVTATDVAGNVTVKSFDTMGVTFDFTPPAVAAPSLQLLPPAGCVLLSSVGSVGVGATARVSFTVTEPLKADPVVSVLSGAWTTSKSNTALFYQYDLELTAGGTQGAQQLSVALADLAGNPATVLVPLPGAGLVVDTVAPTALDEIKNDKLLYTRVPFGSDSLGPTKEFSVKTLAGQTNAVEPNATVIFWDGASVPAAGSPGAGELGRTKAEANGSFAKTLLVATDHPAVYLSQVDDACNVDAATATRLRNTAYVVSLATKTGGNLIDNPHQFQARPWNSGALFQGDYAEGDQGDGLGAVSRPPLLQTASGTTWRLRNADDPPVRSRLGLAFDSARQRTVLFGGVGDGNVYADTWEYDGIFWQRRLPADPEGDGDPSPRNGHAMSYDARRGVTVLFGGDATGETWEYDGTSWLRVLPTDPEGDGNPSARTGHAMAYDSARGRVVLFGGLSSSVKLRDTWEWNGVSWARRSQTGPEARTDSAMAFDAVRGVTVLFGGSGVSASCDGTGDPYYCGGTWTWDGATWVQQSSSGPTPRTSVNLAWDAARGTIVLFGGVVSGMRWRETWTWNGTAWTQLTPTDPESDGIPEGRQGAVMVWDVARQRSVLFGGLSTGEEYNDTWEWNGASWTQKGPGRRNGWPDPRRAAAMAFDLGRLRSVMFGGAGAEPNCDGTISPAFYCGGTWELGSGWELKATTGPTPRENHALAYDTARANTVLFGGWDGATHNCDGNSSSYCSHTWTWDGSGWTKRATTGPTGRTNPALAYGPSARVVLFGGQSSGACDGNATGYCGSTWEWTGAAWTVRAPAHSPSARSATAMAYDTARGRTVLFGGRNGSVSLADTWEWNGTDWLSATVSDPEGDGNPIARSGHVMAYDPQRRRVVLYGGDVTPASGQIGTELWEWNGSSWAKAVVVDPEQDGAPFALVDAAAAWDTSRSALEVFGGAGAADMLWEFSQGVTARPSHVMLVSFDQAVPSANDAIQKVSATWYGGGSGYNGAILTSGATFAVWEGGGWSTADALTNVAAAASPALLASWSTSDPRRIARLPFGPHKILGFEAFPTYPNGTAVTVASVSTDYVEVEVDYKTCPAFNPRVIPVVVGQRTYADNTCKYCNLNVPTCRTTSTGPEVVYKLVVPSTGTWNLDAQSSGFDTVLSLKRDLAMTTDVACNNDATPPGSGGSRLQVSGLVNGATYYLVVDGATNACNDFTLNVTF